MERPSHISFRTTHMSRRLPLFALAAFLQVGAIALIMTGLGHFTPIKEFVFKFVPDTKPPTIDKMPPPEPVIPKTIPTVPTPIVDVFNWDRGDHTITVAPGGGTVEPPKPQPPLPDRAAAAITATHTTPPYPATAIRQGAQGKVLLRLTVLESGRVARAEVVTSSGNDALDQAAQAWILAHWTYRPATAQGAPVASQALASVSFDLRDAR